ncbi:MAG: HAMP domain-containing sensor histidine kinase [Candidatus Promineifilaceae bacterium]
MVESVQTKSLNMLNVDIDRLQLALSQTQRLAGIGTLTASVAHELTNPISIITTACHNLLSRVADDNLNTDELLHYLEMIDHSAWRCARLVRTLGNYSHINEPDKVACDVNDIIEDALALVAYQFQKQFQIEIRTDTAPGLPIIHCDQNQITQVLINLLINARDALRPHGIQSNGGLVEIKSWILLDEPAVAFSVRDNGPGIPARIRDRIFTPFFTTKPMGEGTGLGLSIVKGIVEQHNGRITAENHPDGGALFTVILPVQ